MDVVIIALLACGVAGIALEPRNRTSWLLTAVGVVGAVAVLLAPVAAAHRTPSVTASLERYAVYATFLLATSLLTILPLVYPDGRFERAWHRRAAVIVVVVSVVAPVLLLLGHPTLTSNGDAGTEVNNVIARPGLAPLGQVAYVLVQSEPIWLFLGLLVLALRFRAAGRERRRELWPIVGGLLGLGVFLIPVVVETLGGPEPPQPAFAVVFQAALAMLPVVLLAGISRRTRTLSRDLQASRARLASAEDAARRQIERDLHDGVQQQLVALLSLTELASRQARTGSSALAGTLNDVRAQIGDAIDGLRELVYGIRPPVLQDSGVAAALESRLARLPADVTLDLSGIGERRWPGQTEAAAYFVACEAVTNALKHAPGAPIRVRLTEREGGLHVEVEDDGPGIESATVGRGLTGLRDRVDSSGGAFWVGAGAHGGTLVRAVFS